LTLGRKQLHKTVESMREIRFDLRTCITHPIIGKGRVLCTYPFPLLSPRALVESRVQLRIVEETLDLAVAAAGQ
jgi:DNA (cytosine-5)-methyltransferase 1